MNLFRVRTLMIAVALVALCTAALVLLQRQRRYVLLAAQYAAREQFCLAKIRRFPESGDYLIVRNRQGTTTFEIRTTELQRYSKRRRKYDRAARRPWLAVAPDPASPQ